MAIFLAGGNGEAQVMFVVYKVNSIHKFVGYVLKERKIKTMESSIEYIVI